MAVISIRNYWIIPLSVVIAMMLALIPLPEWGRHIRPDWVALIVIYWSIMLPRYFSIGSAWLSGMMLDVLLGTPLGQNALGLVIIVYISSRMHQQFLTAPLLQQAFSVTLLLLTKQFLSFWISGMSGHLPENLWLYPAPALLSLLLWPWLYIVMRDISQQHRLV